ncbi:hypothetical protein Tco_0985343 [Tanacetum coccineum]
MDPYEEVTQQGQVPPLSLAYVPDLMELDEHVPVYVPEPEHPEYHVPIDDDIQSMEGNSIDYPDEPEDNDEDPEEDPEEDHTDDPADREDGDDEPFDDDDDDDDDTDDEDEEPTKDKEEEEHIALADPSAVPIVDPVPLAEDTEAFETNKSAPTPRSPQKTFRLEPPMSASMEARIAEHAATHIPAISPAYDQAPLGHRGAMIRMRDDIPEEGMPPQRIFVLTAPPPGPGHDARTIARAADRAEDVGYVRALQAFEHRMMTSIEEVNLRVSYQAQVHRQKSEDFYTQLHDAQTDRRDIRLQIDVVRGQRTAYETELHEVRQAYLSYEAWNRALLARLETLESHMSCMEWQRQSAEDRAVR